MLEEFANSLITKKGYYFNEHYLHTLVNFKDIKVDKDQAEMLESISDKLKLIEVYNDLTFRQTHKKNLNLNDKITIKITQFFDTNTKIWLFPNDNLADKWIFNSFKRIISHYSRATYDILKDYEQFYSKNIKIDSLYLYGKSSETLESYTYSEYLSGRVTNLIYTLEDDHQITNQAISNIFQINPSKFILNMASQVILKFNHIYMLVKQPCKYSQHINLIN